MKTSPSQFSRYLFLLTAAVLVVFGLGSFTRIGGNPDLAGPYAFYSFLMFMDAAILLFCAFQLQRKNQKIFRLAVIVLVLNILSTVFDQFGFADLFFVLLNLIALIFLFIARKDFLPA